METLTTIRKMLAGNTVVTDRHQLGYSWEANKQVVYFLSDLENHNKAKAASYYFGHFIFEKKKGSIFGIIDGQQKLTTIIIFLSALFNRLKSIRPLKDNELESFEDLLKRNSTQRFETIAYDRKFFNEYVMNQTKKTKNDLQTKSAKNIMEAFDFYVKKLADKDEEYLLKMLETIENASCTTYIAYGEQEINQLFLSLHNREKAPDYLEIVEAQFLTGIGFNNDEESIALAQTVKDTFKKIYDTVSPIDYPMSGDDILSHAGRIYFNSLWAVDVVSKVDERLLSEHHTEFIREFIHTLHDVLDNIVEFLKEAEKEKVDVQSIVLGGFGIALPFIIKAHKFNLRKEDIEKLSRALESVTLRDRFIGPKTDIRSRLGKVYEDFTPKNTDIRPILDRIEWMKTIDSVVGLLEKQNSALPFRS